MSMIFSVPVLECGLRTFQYGDDHFVQPRVLDGSRFIADGGTLRLNIYMFLISSNNASSGLGYSTLFGVSEIEKSSTPGILFGTMVNSFSRTFLIIVDGS
jgi:hypothetical protein